MSIGENQSAKKAEGRKDTAARAVSLPAVEPKVRMAAALLLPLFLLQLLSVMCSRFFAVKSPKGTWSSPKQQAGLYAVCLLSLEPIHTTTVRRLTCKRRQVNVERAHTLTQRLILAYKLTIRCFTLCMNCERKLPFARGWLTALAVSALLSRAGWGVVRISIHFRVCLVLLLVPDNVICDTINTRYRVPVRSHNTCLFLYHDHDQYSPWYS